MLYGITDMPVLSTGKGTDKELNEGLNSLRSLSYRAFVDLKVRQIG